jgi:uncharacterized protein (DUF1778 family)
MPPSAARAPKTERLALRTSAEAKQLIERAAQALGLNATEFVTAAALREARETLRRHDSTTIPPALGQAFVEAFERTEPTPALVDLMRLQASASKGDSGR